MPEMTPYHQIAEFVAWLRNGTASDEEVEHHLRILEADLEVWAQKLRAIQVPPESAADSSALVEESLQGLELFHHAIGHLRAYMEGREEELADAALNDGRQGVELILRVKGVTEENIEHILDEAAGEG